MHSVVRDAACAVLCTPSRRWSPDVLVLCCDLWSETRGKAASPARAPRCSSYDQKRPELPNLRQNAAATWRAQPRLSEMSSVQYKLMWHILAANLGRPLSSPLTGENRMLSGKVGGLKIANYKGNVFFLVATCWFKPLPFGNVRNLWARDAYWGL